MKIAQNKLTHIDSEIFKVHLAGDTTPKLTLGFT